MLSTKKRPMLSLGSASSRLRVCFWHELLSCAGSSEDGKVLRLCFVPQQQRGCVLPPLFLARLTDTQQQAPSPSPSP